MSIMLAAAGCMAASNATDISLSNFSMSESYEGDTAPSMNASFTLNNDGSLSWSSADSSGSFGWMSPANPALSSQYEVRLTKVSGSNPASGSLGVWLSCGTDRTWTWSQSGYNTTAFSGTLEIRDAAGNIKASSTVSVSLDADPFSALLTVGADAGPVYGYGQGSFGSLSPDTYKGQTFSQISTNTANTLTVGFNGSLPQSFFSSITCTLGTFNTASASSYSVSGGITRWSWNSAGTFNGVANDTITVQ